MNLQPLRKAAHLTQQQLADKSGVGRATIARIELGVIPSPRADTLTSLANTLGCTIDELVRGDRTAAS